MNFREHFESRLLNDVLHRKLTGKEMEIIERIASGLTTAEVAIDLNISVSTVKTHLMNIRNKFNFTVEEMENNTKLMLCIFWQEYGSNIKDPTSCTTS